MVGGPGLPGNTLEGTVAANGELSTRGFKDFHLRVTAILLACLITLGAVSILRVTR